MKALSRVYRIVGTWLLVLFMGYWISITYPNHTHVVNGVTISHSHPYTTNSHHQHSANDFITIDYLTHLLSERCEPEFRLPDTLYLWVVTLLSDNNSHKHISDKYAYFFLRAPPAL